MSVYGLKPQFKNYQEYLQWRKQWASVYNQMTQKIQRSKRDIVFKRKYKHGPQALDNAMRRLREERVMARKLMTVLNEAKLRMAGITKMRKDLVEHQAQFPLTVCDCKTLDFHFNKKHLEFDWMPMWTVKTKGQSYYVNHVVSLAPWSTRETPDHTSTKGAIRLRNVTLTIDEEGTAVVAPIKCTETTQELV